MANLGVDRVAASKAEVDQFAAEFANEARLREVIAELLRKLGHSGVLIPHGVTEKGKDIVFYYKDAMRRPYLCACVVKNNRITGAAGTTTGAGTVLQQARQALLEPFPNATTGQAERVEQVYIYSPYDCAPAAIESIQGQLTERAGQVRFVCGENLLALFRDVWPDFLRFETGLLTRYLASQRVGLEQDPALNALLTRHQVPHTGKTLTDIYVQPQLEQEIWKYSVAELRPLKVSDFTREIKREDVQDLRADLQTWAGILAVGALWAAPTEGDEAEDVGRAAEILVSYLGGGWDSAYAEYERSRTKEQLRKTLKRETSLSISYSAAQSGQLQRIAKCTQTAFEHITALIEAANRFAKSAPAPPYVTEVDPQFIDYCRVRDLARLLPDFIVPHKLVRRLVFQWDFIRNCSGPVLIAGPAGYGKSSFCRWHWLQDERELMGGRDGPIPVYVRLHQFAQSPLASFEETFLFPEVTELLTRANDSRKKRSVRLYLDGLDEIPDRKRQADVVRLAQTGARRYNGLQVVITGRDHVWGPWLGWMPRLRIASLDSTQAQQLAANWLDGQTELQSFNQDLGKTTALASLMAVPLLATLIVNLYRQTRTLPATKARLYSLFVDLLCGGWDAAKQTHRGGRFGPEDKMTVLVRLAALMHLNRRADGGEDTFRAAIRATLASFESRWKELLDEVIQDGLIVRSGLLLMFAHQSFQEFLAARDLQSDPTGRKPTQALRRFLGGDDWWREVVAFYIGNSGAPQEMFHWVRSIRRGSAHYNSRGDFEARIEALQKAVEDYFPGYTSARARPGGSAETQVHRDSHR